MFALQQSSFPVKHLLTEIPPLVTHHRFQRKRGSAKNFKWKSAGMKANSDNSDLKPFDIQGMCSLSVQAWQTVHFDENSE